MSSTAPPAGAPADLRALGAQAIAAEVAAGTLPLPAADEEMRRRGPNREAGIVLPPSRPPPVMAPHQLRQLLGAAALEMRQTAQRCSALAELLECAAARVPGTPTGTTPTDERK